MSFPRAKIQRFNDVLNNVPSPTKYDPKLSEKVKGGCILKGEVKQYAASDTASVTGGKSCQTPVFRTPQLPKKHNCLGVLEKGSHSAFKSITFKSEDMELLNTEGEMEELKALRVECFNKTETIIELEKHIQDLKTQLSSQEKSKIALEAHIKELETAKFNLECIKSNNENYEQQINTLNIEMKNMEAKLNELIKTKEALSVKIRETEKNNNYLEECNLDYERKLISFEGTIEQLQMEKANKEHMIAEMMQKEEIFKMNNKVTIECLQGKIATLENEVKEMDANKSKNEATIFGLETQISNLNCNIESLKSEKNEIENNAKELKAKLGELEKLCKSQSNTILDLEMDLGSKLREMEEIKETNIAQTLKIALVESELEKERLLLKEKENELIEAHKDKLDEIEKIIKNHEITIETERKEFEDKKTLLISEHEEEIFRLQNEYESKLLTQMQEYIEKTNLLQCQVDETIVKLEKTNSEHLESSEKWKNKLKEAENNFSNLVAKLEAKHLETVDEVKENYLEKIKAAESYFSKMLEMKNSEIDVLLKQFNEVVEELKCLLCYLETKDKEIKALNLNNKSINSRIKLMLKEIKILNEEIQVKDENLTKMTKKYNDEFAKNEHLSWKLGELDTTIFYLKEDLKKKIEDCKKLSEELKRSKHLCDQITIQKSDLEHVAYKLQEKVDQLFKELDEKQIIYKDKIAKKTEELLVAKSICKKFEIASGNTNKSLEALRKRLIECENDVEKLKNENFILSEELKKTQEEKSDFEMKLEKMMESKLDLETTLDEQVSQNHQLSQKCNDLEALCNDYESKLQNLTVLYQDSELEKQSHVEVMKNLVKQNELQLIETEKATLDQVEQLNQTVTEKLEFFLNFSSEKIRKLLGEIKHLKASNEETSRCLTSKTEDFDNLLTDYEILKTTVDISVKESENLKKKYEEQVLKMEEVKESLDELVKEKQNLEVKLAKSEIERTEAVEKKINLQTELNNQIESLEKVEKLNKEMNNEILQLKCKAEELEEKLRIKVDELESKVLILEKKISEKDAEIATCQEEKMLCMQELKTLMSEKNDLAFDLKVANGKLLANENLLKELRENKEKLDCNNQQLKLEKEAVLSEKCSLESELLCVKEEVNILKKDNALLKEVEERKNYYKENCFQLDKLNQELRDENISLKNDFNEIHSLLKEKDKKIEKLVKNCVDLENLIGPFREQLEHYETERLLIENDREQLRKQHLEQAAELGHRNHKQKIQHVVNLKNTLLETRKENEKLTLEIKSLKKKIQKLQEQLGLDPKRLFIGGKRPAATPFKGKENSGLMSPTPAMVVSSTTQVKQKPMSPGSPLRNRNH